jgi:hypothetical protein
MRSIVPMVGVLALGVLDVRFVAAQTHDAAAGEALFQDGRRLMKARDFAAACGKFEESLRLDPASGTLLNLADCEEQLGRTASAWQHWLTAADQLPAGDKRRTTALAHASAIEKGLARLSVTLAPSAPADAVVKRDGVALGSGSLGVPLPVDPGRHVVVVSAAGREDREAEVTLRAKEQRTLVVEAGRVSETPAPKTDVARTSNAAAGTSDVWARTSPDDADAQRASSSGRAPVAGYALLGVGVVSAGVGAYFGLSALSARRDASAACPQVGSTHRCSAAASGALDKDKQDSLYADIGFGVGIAAAATGLYLLLKPRHAEPETTADFVPLPGGGEVRFAGRF